MSQTALVHTSAPAAVVQLPSRVGFVCEGSLGIAVPLASVGVHACVDSLHQFPPVQSESTLQPPDGSQVPFELHAPERHTVPFKHGPSPSA